MFIFLFIIVFYKKIFITKKNEIIWNLNRLKNNKIKILDILF